MTANASYRQRQAQETRRRVAAAARSLFAAHGYVATTMDAIAAASEIPVQTIYSSFGTKAAVLEEVRRRWIEESAVAELYAAALHVRDPRDRLARAAHWTRRQFELGHDVIAMYQEAARVDPRVADAWREALRGREVAVRRLLESLAGELASALSQKQALDLYIALTLPEFYRELVVSRGWRPARYESWLALALAWALLAGRP